MDELKRALEWHKQATPNPTDKNKCIALGVHFEEVAEMLEALNMYNDAKRVHAIANMFKGFGRVALTLASGANRTELLDSILDQNVTSCGVSNAYGFDHLGGLGEVNDSNYSKFEDGKPVFNDQGKISKGKDYVKPNLAPFIK